MAYHGPSYGMSAEVAAKHAAKYDVAMENALRNWMEAAVGQPIGADFHEGLKDGQYLCTLINLIRPRTVPKINKMKMPFMMMENIQNFLAGCRALGVKDSDLFAVVDLYEKKNLTLVIQGLHALARAAPAAGFVNPAFVTPQGKAGGDVFAISSDSYVETHYQGNSSNTPTRQNSYSSPSHSSPSHSSPAPSPVRAAEPAPAAASGPKFCPECGTKTVEGCKFCSECGNRLY